MRKTLLVAGFLVFSEANACAASYTKQFGDAGGLLIQYEMTTTTPKNKFVFRNIISGTLTNTTKVLIHCAVSPIVPGYSGSVGLDVTLEAGASQTFSREASFENDNERIVRTKDIIGPSISGWNATCTTPLDYQFSSRAVTTRFSAGIITGVIGRKGIGITVENNSDQPIEIVWDDSSFVDMNRSAKRIFHAGVKYTDREQALPNTTIPPLAKIEDTAIPTEKVSFIGGRYGEWTENPLFPSEVPPELAERTMSSMKGAKVALFLQLLVGEKKTPVTLLFEIAAVKPGNPE
jgi:hypothetical protein